MKKFIRLVLAIQLAILVLIGLAALGLDIPVLRQFIGFIYLTFVPGFLILCVMRFNNLSTIETLLYSVGLSIAFVMFLGFLMNLLYPLIGISNPISLLPMMGTMTAIVLILLGIIAYKRRGTGGESLFQFSALHWSDVLSPPALLLFLLPLLAALGTRLVYLQQSNILLFVLLSLIALIVVLVAFGKFIPTKLYPLAVVAIAIAILWHWSLVSPYLPIGDISVEYAFQNLVMDSSVWDSSISSNVGSMLSIVMLIPTYSLVLNLDSVWVMKLIIPLFFSLVPLVLFQAYRKQTDDKIAFLAVFFFMAMGAFFTVLLVCTRQQVAELFLALSMLLILDKRMVLGKRGFLLVIFGFSIAVSHYGVSYIYMLYLLMALPLLLLSRSEAGRKIYMSLIRRFSKFRYSEDITTSSTELASRIQTKSTLNVSYVVLFIIFCLVWYMYIGGGYLFRSVVIIGEDIFSTIITDFFAFGARDPMIWQALGLTSMRALDVEWEIARIFQYLTQIFIVVGIVGLISNLHKTKFHPEYSALSLANMVILAMCIIIPSFAALNMARMYHITLLFLAPFFILGGITVCRWLFRIPRAPRLRNLTTSFSLSLVVTLVLIPYFFFNTGFIFALTGATPTSLSLSLYEADWPFVTDAEASAGTWLAELAVKDVPIYSGRERFFYTKHPMKYVFSFREAEQPLETSYVYLRRWNILHGEIRYEGKHGIAPIYIDLDEVPILSDADAWDRIYNNGDTQVLRHK